MKGAGVEEYTVGLPELRWRFFSKGGKQKQTLGWRCIFGEER